MQTPISSPYSSLTWRNVQDLIDRQLLQAHFQPIADLRDGSIHAHEALIRGPSGSVYALPDALFAAAHKEGCAYELEVECVKRALFAWSLAGRSGRLFLNFSASTLVRTLRERSVDAVIDAARKLGISPSTIVIELTEHEQVRDPATLLETCAVLRWHGAMPCMRWPLSGMTTAPSP
jgi:EAL domain-containing protein (putative c-di-GMP-specific phosphodiesterase class I)